MTPAPRERPPISVHDPILGPVLAARSDDPVVFRVALAVTCRALDAGVPPHAVRIWLRSRGGSRFDRITASPSCYRPVLSRARAKVASASSPSARRREAVAVARRMVGSLLTPVSESAGVSGHRQAMARHALAIIGLALLASNRDEGRDTVLVSGAWLGVRMGCTAPTARTAMRTCIELGWLRQVVKRPGGSGRYDLPRLDKVRGATAEEFAFTVDALAQGDPTLDEVAEIMAAAGHPAVGYGHGTKAWVTVLATAAEMRPAVLGAPKRGAAELQREWMAMLMEYTLDDDPAPPLVEVLDGYADPTGAQARFVAAEAARREAVQERVRGVEAARERNAKARAAVARLLDAHAIPPTTAGREDVETWAVTLAETLAASGIPDELRRPVARVLIKRMRRDGYAEAVAERIACYVTGEEVG